MGVYKRFDDNDILQSVVYTRPRILLASGTQGWHGNTGLSGSLSLYAGIRGRNDVKLEDLNASGLAIYPIDPLDTHSIDRVVYVSGSYPSTGSVAYVKCRNEPASNFTQITDQFWYEEHYRPIELLYEYYGRYNTQRFIGCHDFYSLYFMQNQPYLSPVVSYTGSGLSTMTSSYTVEAWVKPTYVTSSAQDYVIMGQRARWKLYITGASGKLAFTDYRTTVTSSVTLTPGVWTHVAFVADGASGSFYLDSSLDNRSAFTGSLIAYSAAQTASHLSVGAEYVYSGNNNFTIFGNTDLVATFGASEGVGGPYIVSSFISAEQAGTITHVKYYKSAADPATSRKVEIWSTGGTLLAYGTSSGEPTGTRQWLSCSLVSPLSIVSGTQYVVGVRTDDFFFKADAGVPLPYPNPPLYAHNGKYDSVGSLTTGAPVFPTTDGGNFYFVDVVLTSGSLDAMTDQGFRGFLYETKVWSAARSAAQISGTWNRTLNPSESGSSTLLHYSRFNDGPLGYAHGYTQGSGAFDYGRSGIHGKMINFGTVLPLSPTWQPNDNVDFYTYKTAVSSTGANFLRAVHIPSLYYGRQIASGSVVLECHAYEDQGLVRTIKDDGKGGLYISGSLCRPIGNEDYEGVKWRKVGDVFYSEGLIVITDPCLWDFGETDLDATRDADVLRVTFEGLERVPTKVFMCHLPGAEYNASNNPTFSAIDPGDPDDLTDDKYIAKTNVTYVTAIGIYDEHRNLVAVAKIAQPIRKREMDRLTIRLKMDL